MRISDWSSDVCSSDLVRPPDPDPGADVRRFAPQPRDAGESARPDLDRNHGAAEIGRRDRLRRRADRIAPFQPDTAHRDRRRPGARPRHLRRAGEARRAARSEAYTSELQSLLRISYAVYCLTKKIQT